MICCLGAGPGDLGYLTLRGRELIETADVVAGFRTVVDLVRPLIRGECQIVTMGYKDQTEMLEKVASLHHRRRQMCRRVHGRYPLFRFPVPGKG